MAIKLSDFFFRKLYLIQFEDTFCGQELQAVIYFLVFENSNKIELKSFLIILSFNLFKNIKYHYRILNCIL